MNKYLAGAAVAALFVAVPAAATPGIGSNLDALKQRITSNVQTKQTYQGVGQINRWVSPDNVYTGVGSLFIEIEGAGGAGFACSGSLIAPTLVLTAAHCLDTGPDTVAGVSFFLPGFRNAAGTRDGREVIDAVSWTLHPLYNSTDNGVLGPGDLAVVELGTPASNLRDIYALYDGSGEFDNPSYQKVGTGSQGTGGQGTFDDPFASDLRKRVGLNEYEFTWGDVIDVFFGLPPGASGCAGAAVFGFACNEILTFDFDNGRARNDVFGRFLGKPDGGVYLDGILVEANSAPGDSGGPTFIDGRIAGITSFGITGNIFEPGDCAIPGSVDMDADPTGFCTNSSWGEISGDTRVSAYLDWLNPFLAEHSDPNRPTTRPGFWTPLFGVPEPATWAMMLAGFGLIGTAARRRRRMAAA